MTEQEKIMNVWKPGRLFYLGLGLVMLALWIPFIPGWYTFIHMWRVELAASIFLFATLSYLHYRAKRNQFCLDFSKCELNFVIFPLLALIIWSTLSIAWAPSWKSAMHHALVWSLYLLFYGLFSYLTNHARNYSKLTTFFVITIILLTIPAIVEYCAFLIFGGTTTIGMRYAKYGEQIVTLLPLVLIGVLRMNGRQFLLGLSGVIAMWLLIFCTFGRINIFLFGSCIAAVTALIFIFKQFHKYRLKMAFIIAVLALSLIPLQFFSVFSENPNIPILNRLKDENGLNSSNDFRKLMISISLEMISANPIIGIGADNFGMQVNKYRAIYALKNPNDPNLSAAENEIPAHAHNEFLQILAELGIVGGAILLWFLAGIALMTYLALKDLRIRSLYPMAAVLGLGAFLISSLVSSYSFRVMQNGFVFFFVLAVAVKLILKKQEMKNSITNITCTKVNLRLIFASGMLACLLLATYSGFRVSSAILNEKANYTQNLEAATPLYQLAMQLDNENPNVRNNYGMRLFQEKRFAEAIPYLSEAITIGRAPSSDFSYLASAQALIGNNLAAERTMAAANDLYPRSPFVLTRYAILLMENGKLAESAASIERARQINLRATNTWWTMIKDGPRAASQLAAKNDDYIEVMDLQPQSSIYAVVDERDVRFPNERTKLLF